MTATKHDQGKQKWMLILSYLPEDTLHEVARVMEYGAETYGYNNWADGLDWSRMIDASMRHLVLWVRAKLTGTSEFDEESGLHHMAHFACDALFLLTYALRGAPGDDRIASKPKKEKPEAAKALEDLPALSTWNPADLGCDWHSELGKKAPEIVCKGMEA